MDILKINGHEFKKSIITDCYYCKICKIKFYNTIFDRNLFTLENLWIRLEYVTREENLLTCDEYIVKEIIE